MDNYIQYRMYYCLSSVVKFFGFLGKDEAKHFYIICRLNGQCHIDTTKIKKVFQIKNIQWGNVEYKDKFYVLYMQY